MADEDEDEAALDGEEGHIGRDLTEFMDGIGQAPVKQTIAQPPPSNLAFTNFFPSLARGQANNHHNAAEHFARNIDAAKVITLGGKRMDPAWFPSFVNDHFDKPTGALWHRFIITRYRKCESIAKFNGDGYWCAFSCPGCGANCNVKGYYMQNVMITLKHIHEAHPEWQELADPKTERAFFELMAHDGTPLSKEAIWEIEQGTLSWPLEKRKIGDVHPTHTFGKPRVPVGSPGMATPPGVAASRTVAGPSSSGKGTVPPSTSHPTAPVANSGKRTVPPKV